jgi:peptidoglycan/LPS O-acetylase OafA/YrhL
MLKEERYLAALRSGDPTAIASQRTRLEEALEALLTHDSDRLREVNGQTGPAIADERAFLRARSELLDARLLALSADQPDHSEVPAPMLERTRQQSQEPSQRHRDDVQGMRAVAVLLVALCHAGVGFLAGGYVGVDVFFVISGFLITGLLIAQARQRRYVSLVEFYLRRARRILPAAALTLVATDVVAYRLLNIVRADQVLHDSIPSALFAANIHFSAIGTDYFAQGQPPSPLQHFWSLAVEEQFYVVWPALFALGLGLAIRKLPDRPTFFPEWRVGRVFLLVVVVALASLGFSTYYTPGHAAAAYFSTPARIWELGLGAALALMAWRFEDLGSTARLALGWGGVAAIAISAVAFSSATRFPGYAAALPTLGAVAVLVAGISTTRLRLGVGRVLSLAPMRYIGDRSYSFYLWHWPVLIIAAQYKGRSLPLSTNLLLLLGAFVLSDVTYRLYERPIRGARWSRHPGALFLWPASVVLVLVVAGTYISSIEIDTTKLQAAASTPVNALAVSRPARVAARSGPTLQVSQLLPAVVAEVNAESHHHGMPAVLHPAPTGLLNDLPRIPSNCLAHNGQTSSSICRLGAAGSSKTLVLIGDSHADMWTPAVLGFAARDGWSVITLLKSACSPPMWESPIGPAECRVWFRWAMQHAAALHPTVAVVAGQYSHLGIGPDQARSPA